MVDNGWGVAISFSRPLGYADIVLADQHWRLLSGIEALAGILLAGWSTALLFVVVQRSWKKLGRKDAGA